MAKLPLERLPEHPDGETINLLDPKSVGYQSVSSWRDRYCGNCGWFRATQPDGDLEDTSSHEHPEGDELGPIHRCDLVGGGIAKGGYCGAWGTFSFARDDDGSAAVRVEEMVDDPVPARLIFSKDGFGWDKASVREHIEERFGFCAEVQETKSSFIYDVIESIEGDWQRDEDSEMGIDAFYAVDVQEIDVRDAMDLTMTNAVALAEERLDKKKTRQARRLPTGFAVQTLVLSKKQFESVGDARKWISGHGFKTRLKGKGPDETSTSYRFRQRPPGDFQAGTFRTFRITDGVQAVGGRLKRG